VGRHSRINAFRVDACVEMVKSARSLCCCDNSVIMFDGLYEERRGRGYPRLCGGVCFDGLAGLIIGLDEKVAL